MADRDDEFDYVRFDLIFISIQPIITKFAK